MNTLQTLALIFSLFLTSITSAAPNVKHDASHIKYYGHLGLAQVGGSEDWKDGHNPLPDYIREVADHSNIFWIEGGDVAFRTETALQGQASGLYTVMGLDGLVFHYGYRNNRMAKPILYSTDTDLINAELQSGAYSEAKLYQIKERMQQEIASGRDSSYPFYQNIVALKRQAYFSFCKQAFTDQGLEVTPCLGLQNAISKTMKNVLANILAINGLNPSTVQKSVDQYFSNIFMFYTLDEPFLQNDGLKDQPEIIRMQLDLANLATKEVFKEYKVLIGSAVEPDFVLNPNWKLPESFDVLGYDCYNDPDKPCYNHKVKSKGKTLNQYLEILRTKLDNGKKPLLMLIPQLFRFVGSSLKPSVMHKWFHRSMEIIMSPGNEDVIAIMPFRYQSSLAADVEGARDFVNPQDPFMQEIKLVGAGIKNQNLDVKKLFNEKEDIPPKAPEQMPPATTINNVTILLPADAHQDVKLGSPLQICGENAILITQLQNPKLAADSLSIKNDLDDSAINANQLASLYARKIENDAAIQAVQYAGHTSTSVPYEKILCSKNSLKQLYADLLLQVRSDDKILKAKMNINTLMYGVDGCTAQVRIDRQNQRLSLEISRELQVVLKQSAPIATTAAEAFEILWKKQPALQP